MRKFTKKKYTKKIIVAATFALGCNSKCMQHKLKQQNINENLEFFNPKYKRDS